ncbi:MAG: hypothetical protein J0L97_00810 [Alphaproteobacteria bacterium]|nr:hypothetical protein [Alphaproteobacteria bacterium]
MITLLSTLLGFLGAAMPDVFKIFRDRADRFHELAILDRQMELQKLGLSQRLEEIRISSEAAESQALYKTWKSGVDWVDALNGTVRPVLAYAFFLLYFLVKMAMLAGLAKVQGQGFLYSLPLVWQEEDQAIFAGIISFYFGQRALRRMRGGQHAEGH